MRQLAARQRRRLFQAWLLLAAVSLLLRLLGLRACQRLLDRWSPLAAGADDSDARREASEVVWLTAVAARRTPGRPTCLPQALVARWLLRRTGIDARLRLGVRKQDGQFAAHAWVECCGQVIEADRRAVVSFVPFVGELGVQPA